MKEKVLSGWVGYIGFLLSIPLVSFVITLYNDAPFYKILFVSVLLAYFFAFVLTIVLGLENNFLQYEGKASWLMIIVVFVLFPFMLEVITLYFLPDKDYSYLIFLFGGMLILFISWIPVFNIYGWLERLLIRESAIKILRRSLELNSIETKIGFSEFSSRQSDYYLWVKEVLLKRPGEHYSEDQKKIAEIRNLALKIYGYEYFDEKMTSEIKQRVNLNIE